MLQELTISDFGFRGLAPGFESRVSPAVQASTARDSLGGVSLKCKQTPWAMMRLVYTANFSRGHHREDAPP